MELPIYEFINQRKPSILAKWQRAAFGPDANDNPMIEKKSASRFADPMAYLIEKSTAEILEWLIKGENDVDLSVPLEEICRLKAVQDARPAEAVSFIFSLKQIIREELADETNSVTAQLWDINKRIDEIGLLAFNIYLDCRTKIYELKINEIKRMYGRDAG